MPEHHSEAATPPHRTAPAPGALLDPASSDRCGVSRLAFPETVRIGSATLIRADALDVLAALAPGSIGGVLTDPPYSSGGLHIGDRTRAPSEKYQSPEHRGLHPEFLGDNRDQRSYLAWSALWMRLARRALAPGAILAAFTDWRQLPVTTDAVQVAGLVWRGVVPWNKTASVRPQLGRYRNQAEYLVWATNGPRPLTGPVADGAYTRAVPRQKLHMTAKPACLMRELLTVHAGVILDPFMGSSPVGEACAELGLEYIGVEADPHYFDVACRRLADHAARGERVAA